MDKKLLLTIIFTVLIVWLVFLAIFTTKNGCDINSIERQAHIAVAAAITGFIAIAIVAIAAILGKANLFATSIVAASFMAAGSYFAHFHFSFLALGIIGIIVGWLILKMASTETDKKKMKFSAISLTVEGVLILAPVLILIFL